jgi:hypothetical protein
MIELQERILTTETSKRMLKMVSPIYDNSYVGLWLIETIGREYEGLWGIINSFPLQLAPDTVTWAIELWEKRYGISPDETKTIEQRRAAIITMRSVPRPLTPHSLRARLFDLTGRWAEIDEHIGDFTFGVYLESSDGMQISDFTGLLKYIDKHKQAHMSYELWFQTSQSIRVSVSTGYWALQYPMTGTADAGTLPDTSMIGGSVSPGIRASPAISGYKYDYGMCGTLACGASG